jgi:hypothetical protein
MDRHLISISRHSNPNWQVQVLDSGSPSIDKVDAEEMQNQAPKNEIRECPTVTQHVSTGPSHSHTRCAVPHNRDLNMTARERKISHLSCDTPSVSFPRPVTSLPAFAGTEETPFPLAPSTELVCIRKLAVRTNWPTAAQKPLRKALKGCFKKNPC